MQQKNNLEHLDKSNINQTVNQETASKDRKTEQNGKGNKKTRRSKRIRNSLKNLTILYVNIRGLKSKLDSLENIITEVDPSIMCPVETHLEVTDQVEVGGYTLPY